MAKHYGRVAALDDFSIAVPRGEVFCLLGPNGSGKTTFLRLLAGVMTPTAGTLEVAGLDAAREPLAVRRRIGYAPEPAPAWRHMRVHEFLACMARLRGLRRDEVDAAVERAADRLDLRDRLGAMLPTLSRGYRQRVCLAQALVHDPEILILDEPGNGLDPRQSIEMRALIRSLAGSHTVLMTSHLLPEVVKTAHRVAVLLGGRLRGEREVRPGDDLEDWFLSLA